MRTLTISDPALVGKVPVNLGVSDSFTRPNSTSSLGSTDGALSGDPQAWTAGRGTWGIYANGAYCYSVSSWSAAWVDSGLADNITTCRATEIRPYGWMLAARYVDADNFLGVYLGSGTIRLAKIVSGGLTDIASGGGYANGDLISIRCQGTSIEVRRNGTVAYAASSTQFQTATKQALACFGPNNQWDDFSVAPA